MNSVEITARFSSAHFYSQKTWSEDRNRQEFGRCFTPHGHGHNYVAKVCFNLPEGQPQLLEELRNLVLQQTDRLDHEHLNFVIPEFKDQVPTTENIALWLCRRLQEQTPPARLEKVTLFETDDLWVEVTP